REFRGYLFPSFAAGIQAMRDCQRTGAMPALTRLNDPAKTQLSAAFHRRSTGLKAVAARAVKAYLRRVRGVRFDSACLLIAAFEGDARQRRWDRRRVEAVYRSHGGIGVGRGPGEGFAEGKFDFPYIRDFLMDHDVLVDVAETATVWGNIMPLYSAAMR